MKPTRLALLIWFAIALVLRFLNLSAKSPWNDELATLIFSLGNSLKPVPIDQIISLDTLLEPLKPRSNANFADVVRHLMSESTHPPIYFLLTHAWLKLFPAQDGLVSVWAARSLSALLGAIAVPAVYALGLLWNRRTAIAAAALMAVSPYGVYLAQEARHYTLAILLMIASIGCLLIALQSPNRSRRFSLIWIAVNALGVAVHYFFTLVLAAEGIAVLISAWRCRQQASWQAIRISAIGTAIGVLVWLPVWLQVSENELTTWIYDPNFLEARFAPLGRLVIWVMTMLTILPVQDVPSSIAILSGAIMLLFLIWAIKIVWDGLAQPQQNTNILLVLLGSIATLLLFITYGLQADLTIAARYQFIYFPTLLLLVAVAIAQPPHFARTLIVFAIVGSLGSLTVAYNYGYQKPDRPDQLVPILEASTQAPTIVIAMAHQTHEQTRELMGLALELHRSHSPLQPNFLLAHFDPASPGAALASLEKAIAPLPRPLDLWLMNFRPAAAPAIKGCNWDLNHRSPVNGYKHRLYRCPA
ncbi:glycosyltransferase family 39 protein [Microcoleus sp. FACHB-1515]|uniref:glycosyltransferase family 39 protein n=1 Tax=Cyanophyceae TaxID=3028117 RepID=UPI001681FB98|nr:glycosyltransferase family 39 protein [Microcoleus sp. FACHB-1515]MBD2088551.1 glycosyltransferase family 39 protein [Microcoleus sp. FACHB-1515]